MFETDNTNYYKLYIYLDTSILKPDIIQKYENKINNIQKQFEKDIEKGSFENLDAGFDLFLGESLHIPKKKFSLIHNHGIKCVMKFGEKNTAFYLYPRSSMGAKTPLRLSNSVGIIDSGYRGHIKAILDNNSDADFKANYDDRLLQICGPNIMYPIYPILVDNEEKLGVTKRGDKGLGSSGK